MVQSNRGGPPLDQVCQKHSCFAGFRLRAEYVPAELPFPDSPEEAAWVERRETVVLTAMRSHGAGLLLVEHTRGGKGTIEERALSIAEFEQLAAALEARGAWKLDRLAVLKLGEGQGEFAHDAYAYHDPDPDSLDLDSWEAPRYWRVERGRDGAGEPETRGLLGVWAAFLPPGVTGGSPLGAAFAAA